VVGALPWCGIDRRASEGGVTVSVQLSMVGLMVRDMAASLTFYRRLGLPIPEGEEAKRFVLHRMESGVSLFWDTIFADTYDPAREAPTGGYRVMLEFFLADEAAVDAKYAELTGYGYGGRRAPVQTNGPYAAMVDDPDGNVVLITAG
jgi:catechol 2,3-dioxygenase-like lactoylglutathione lyase family enzyme